MAGKNKQIITGGEQYRNNNQDYDDENAADIEDADKADDEEEEDEEDLDQLDNNGPKVNNPRGVTVGGHH